MCCCFVAYIVVVVAFVLAASVVVVVVIGVAVDGIVHVEIETLLKWHIFGDTHGVICFQLN